MKNTEQMQERLGSQYIRCTTCDHREADHFGGGKDGHELKCYRCYNYTCDPKAKCYGG